MKVSVLINNYNYGCFLDDCLQSLSKQTVSPFEVIFYDDGSSDNSIKIAKKYSFVTIIANENYGNKPCFNQANAIYQAFLKSSGDIICLLDSDDFFEKNKIETIINAFKSNEKAVLVQNAYYEFRKGEPKIKKNWGVNNSDYIELYYKKDWTSFFNPTSCLSFRRWYLLQRLPIKEDENWKVWSDVRLSRLAPFYGEVINLEGPLTNYRKHGNSDSDNLNRDYKKTLENQISHHEYINKELKLMGKRCLRYKYSFSFFKYYLKAMLPKKFVNLITK